MKLVQNAAFPRVNNRNDWSNGFSGNDSNQSAHCHVTIDESRWRTTGSGSCCLYWSSQRTCLVHTTNFLQQVGQLCNRVLRLQAAWFHHHSTKCLFYRWCSCPWPWKLRWCSCPWPWKLCWCSCPWLAWEAFLASFAPRVLCSTTLNDTRYMYMYQAIVM